MELVGVGYAVSQQLLHFLNSGVDVGAELGSSLFALVFAFGNVFVGVGLLDAAVLALIDFELELHVDIPEEDVELVHFALIILLQFFLSGLRGWVVQ